MRPVMVARRNFASYDSPIRSAGRGAVLHWSGTPFQMKASEGHSIRVRASAGDYSVACRPGILRQAGRAIEKLGVFTSVHILSSPKVWRFVGEAARRGISPAREPRLHLFDDAEAAKNLGTVEEIARKLVRAGADRKALLIAVGGGVVGDVAGFVAAAYLRGVPLVQVPTTVVAQVDSAVGGKAGVNLPEGKNLVGAFYPPRLVLVDPDVLSTLPEREFRGGLAEVIKYGVIADSKLFRFLEENIARILKRDARALQHVIRRSIEIKATVVSRDEKESGLREILNFGHTFGHALESATHYRRFQHGEAVALGMMCAALLGHEVLQTPADQVSRMVALIRRIGPFPTWPRISADRLLEAMGSDKKAKAGKLRFVLTPRLGCASSYSSVPTENVLCVLRFGPQLVLRAIEELETCDA
jgi:3-dehydroquinate synthase